MSEERGTRGGTSRSAGAAGVDGTATDSPSDVDSAAARPSGKRSVRASAVNTQVAASSVTSSVSKAAGRTATAPSGPAVTKRGATKPSGRGAKPRTENIFKRLRRFFREVIAELRKVIWPNRKQLITYTTVVLVFVSFMTALIFGLDLAFVKGVSWLFG